MAGDPFQAGHVHPRVTPEELRDHHDVTLPDASRSIVLAGRICVGVSEFDTAENVCREARAEGHHHARPNGRRRHGQEQPPQSFRSAQRHFLRATGLTYRDVRQIERARYATNLLRQGTSILDTVYEAGYFDQPHLTRSLKLLVGQTPVELGRGAAQLSFLYKTERRP